MLSQSQPIINLVTKPYGTSLEKARQSQTMNHLDGQDESSRSKFQLSVRAMDGVMTSDDREQINSIGCNRQEIVKFL